MNTRSARGPQQGDANFLQRHAAVHWLGGLRHGPAALACWFPRYRQPIDLYDEVRVLIIEDERKIGQVLRTALEAEDYEVRVATANEVVPSPAPDTVTAR